MAQSIPKFVSAEDTIGDVVMRYPVTAEIMLSYGLHCVGCHVNQFESIRQGAMGHGGMDDEEVADLVAEMNEAIAEREGAHNREEPLFVTKRAHEKIAEFAADEDDKESMFLRVAVLPGGCCSVKYDLDWDRQPRDDDVVVTGGEYDIRIGKESLPKVEGSVLDFIEGLHGSGFKIDNPNKKECGCSH